MRILFLHHSEALGRIPWYMAAAESMKLDHGHEVVFVYTALEPNVHSDVVETHHFESWVRGHRDLVDRTDVADLEARFPNAHLWLCAVAERRFTDYSFMGRGHWCNRLSRAEIEFYLKGMVLFYESLVREHGIDTVIAHDPDNIHSTMLYELERDLGYHAVAFYPDVYWDATKYWLTDDQMYRSDLLATRHRMYLDRYDELVAPREEECAEFVRRRTERAPMKNTPLLAPRGLGNILSTTLGGFWRGRDRFRLTRPDPLDAYHQRDLPDAVVSALTRVANHVVSGEPGARSIESLGRFVFFPLHLQPEAVLLASAPVFNNQLAVVQAISASLPAGWTLAVKDHPIIAGRRDASFYHGIEELPNTVLVNARVSGTDLVERCDIVVTIKGTAGFEALLRGKTVLTLAPVWYETLAGVEQVRDYAALPRVLKRALIAPPDERERARRRRSLYAFVAAFQSIQHSEPDYESSEPARKGRGLARLLLRMIEDRNAGIAAAGFPDPRRPAAPA